MTGLPSAFIPSVLGSVALAAASFSAPAFSGEVEQSPCLRQRTLAATTPPVQTHVVEARMPGSGGELIAQAPTGRVLPADFPACTYRVPPVPQVPVQVPIRGLY